MSGRGGVATGRPWLDASLGVDERVAALLAAMTPAERVGQLHQVASPDPVRDAAALRAGAVGSCLVASGAQAGNVRDAGTRAGAVDALQRVAVEESRLGVPLLVARDVIHGHRTVFPVPLGLAASFDADLVRRCARAAAREATADGIRWTFAPAADVAHDARWGRVAEGWGEDPWLASLLTAAAVEGFQGGPAGGGLGAPDAMAACAKHYVGYGLVQGGRDYAEVDVGPVTLHNRHLRPFAAAVDAGVATVMTAFHTLDGTPMTAHTPLVREHLKGRLGFAGVVVSDWDAVAELLEHGVAADGAHAARRALEAGVDVDMVSGLYAAHLERLVRDGTVPSALLDDAVSRVLALKVRLGLFEDPYTDPGRAGVVHLSAEHRALAREAAAGAVVVLRDDGRPAVPAGARVHLTGPFATARAELFGTWTLDGRAEDAVTIVDAARERFGAEAVTADDGRFPDASLVAAREADVVVACVGEHPLRSGEANSVTSLDLPPGQRDVLTSLRRVARRLVVLVLAGRPLALDGLPGDVLALVLHPGVEGGHGVVDVLSGDVPARGRLPFGVPRATGQVPLHHDHLPTGRPLDPDGPVGRYRDERDDPLHPFGAGASWRHVTYGPLTLSSAALAPGRPVRVTTTLSSAAAAPVVETAQLHARVEVARVSRPVSELVGVRRVTLAPGATCDVTFELAADELAYLGPDGAPVLDDAPVTVRIGPHARAGSSARLTLAGGGGATPAARDT